MRCNVIAINNGSLPILPLKERTIQVKREGALATVAQRSDLIEATLAFDIYYDLGDGKPQLLKQGTTLYLMPEAAFQPWNKAVFELSGTVFVRVPTSCIYLVGN